MTNEPKQPGVTPGSQKELDPAKFPDDTTDMDPTFFEQKLISNNRPITDDDFCGLIRNHTNSSVFSEFPAAGTITKLLQEGITLTWGDLQVLDWLLSHIGSFPELRVSPEDLIHEKKLLETATTLLELLEEEEFDFDEVRTDYEYDEENMSVEVKDDIDIGTLSSNLEQLVESSTFRINNLEATFNSKLRLKRRPEYMQRHFYWLALASYWKHYLGKDIGSSTSLNNADVYGPMIRFFQILNFAHSPELTGTSIRSWYRKHALSIDDLEGITSKISSYVNYSGQIAT